MNQIKFTAERFIPRIEGWQALDHYHRYFFVQKQIELKDKVVLDLACGEGFGTNILSKYSKFVFGIDISEEIIIHAQEKYSNQNSRFLTGRAALIPLDDNSVDVVVSFETIEHHNQHTEMMDEIKRILKIDGILIISSPDKGFYKKYLPEINNEFHVKELFNDEFKKLISNYFNHFEIFIQNNVIGSLIACENENGDYKRPIHIEKSSGSSDHIEPRFNIIMASDHKFHYSTSVSICTPSFYYDIFSVMNDQYVINNQQKELIYQQKELIERLYNTNTWKIGRFFTFPIRKIREFLK